MDDKDIVFLSEAHCNSKSLGNLSDFNVYGDPSFPLFQRHGGLAVYVNSFYSPYINNLRFTKCTISFSLSIIPKVFYMGVYMYPTDSDNYDLGDFGIITDEVKYWLCKGFTPYMGGDFNSRLGNLDEISAKSLGWCYANNVDEVRNGNYKDFVSMCELLNILPVNHTIFKKKQFMGHWTYFKGNKKSQIDFLVTDNKGRERITSFDISTNGWHFSDHLPIDVSIDIPYSIDPLLLLARAKLLNEETVVVNQPSVKCFKNNFDMDKGKKILLEKSDTILFKCQNQSVDTMLDVLNENIEEMLEVANVPKTKKAIIVNNSMSECDELFNRYLVMISSSDNIQEIKDAYDIYQTKRNELNRNMLSNCHTKYKDVIEAKDARRMWQMIDWSGNSRREHPKNHPSVFELSEHFKNLYDPIENEEKVNSLTSNVSIPITDDPITPQEILDASQKIKKGGYDYPNSVLKVLVSTILPVIILFLNTILFSIFPSKLAVSILSAIPKFGNLALPTNYRGIQMQPLLAVLYDRILAQRLLRWVRINDEQTAFQKGKGTIDQIFMLRLLIGLAKFYKAPKVQSI